MAALRDVAMSGMTSTVYIYNRSTTQTEDGQETSYPATPSSTVLGWLYEMTPDAGTLTIISGGESLSELFRLLLPVGTTIASGDKVIVGNSIFYVQHLNEDNTHLPVLVAALRHLI
jgi:hypothetical protein